ncbi:MAG: hypothetical protein AB8B91_05645 [Rubripirellula sp.]
MSDSSVTNLNPNNGLRSDLRSVVVDGQRRSYRIIIDEVSGKFTRVTERVWQALQSGHCDESVWREAGAAGWTRRRFETAIRRFSPLYFRVPLGTIDGIATRLSSISGMVFSLPAILCWTTVIAVAFVFAFSRSSELVGNLTSLQLFLSQSSPLWLGILFASTKVAHELGHAVMCRRMGSRCGSVGVLFLCGVPCPYCDVTDIWRQPSSAKRAAVMMAGIYIELIIAAIATFVWIGTTDPAIRLHALNLMVICGISTVLFNANPLMRYDGYYVLADIIGSVNLRQEATHAFRSVVVSRIAGDQCTVTKRTDLRSLSLAGYHTASMLYRLIIMLVIASVLIGLAEYLHLRSLAIAVVFIAAFAQVAKLTRLVARVTRGTEHWGQVPRWRRLLPLSALGILLALALWMPLPRFRSADGNVDLANASTIFLAGEGMIEQVAAEFGEPIRIGETLVKMRNESLAIDHARLQGQLRVARMRSNLSRRVTLDQADRAEQWKTLQAAEDAVSTQLASIAARVRETEVVAPIDGIVLPPPFESSEQLPRTRLRDQIGMAAVRHDAWCRISPDSSLHAVLMMDARDRKQIEIGSTVQLSLCEAPEIVYSSTVVSVSAMAQDNSSVTQQAAYRVLCPLPPVEQGELMSWVGKECHGVFHLPNRTFAADLTQWLSEWIGG